MWKVKDWQLDNPWYTNGQFLFADKPWEIEWSQEEKIQINCRTGLVSASDSSLDQVMRLEQESMVITEILDRLTDCGWWNAG